MFETGTTKHASLFMTLPTRETVASLQSDGSAGSQVHSAALTALPVSDGRWTAQLLQRHPLSMLIPSATACLLLCCLVGPAGGQQALTPGWVCYQPLATPRIKLWPSRIRGLPPADSTAECICHCGHLRYFFAVFTPEPQRDPIMSSAVVMARCFCMNSIKGLHIVSEQRCRAHPSFWVTYQLRGNAGFTRNCRGGQVQAIPAQETNNLAQQTNLPSTRTATTQGGPPPQQQVRSGTYQGTSPSSFAFEGTAPIERRAHVLRNNPPNTGTVITRGGALLQSNPGGYLTATSSVNAPDRTLSRTPPSGTLQFFQPGSTSIHYHGPHLLGYSGLRSIEALRPIIQHVHVNVHQNQRQDVAASASGGAGSAGAGSSARADAANKAAVHIHLNGPGSSGDQPTALRSDLASQLGAQALSYGDGPAEARGSQMIGSEARL